MVEDPTAYFSQWICDRSKLLKKMELEAAEKDIPIVGPVVGQLLYLMTRISNARRLLELGTATGYSAIFMGAACRQNQGGLVCFEIDPTLAAKARANIDKAGLSDVVDVLCQDAFAGLTTIEGLVDMVFMDVEKQDYVELLPGIDKIIKPNGLLIADNTGFKDAHRFNREIQNNPCWTSVNLWSFLPGHSPEYDGICIAVKTPPKED